MVSNASSRIAFRFVSDLANAVTLTGATPVLADVDPATAQFMADAQVPWGLEALSGKVSDPAWKSKPSFYLVATDDRMIPPPAQRQMAERAGADIVEAGGSHAIYVSKPEAVVEVIERAASLAM